MICLDQPNRLVRTRTLGGVGGGLRKGAPYPVITVTKSRQAMTNRMGIICYSFLK